ncbi:MULTISPECIES: hypothetical protein [Clostridium]|jgi:hypothetical protein|uniref:Uncharacterized protein n=3 Tax=Clostridium TaxID=1485 RepID=A0AAE5H2I5_CLOBE|nr:MULTISPECIES: hypothetical protein [Clostridium]ALB44901.1 hypothetical protein X276_06210 [Clostridium beijerinckii NRRL B-598]AVK47930.1 hypothetical protein AXY43_07780 [Clostridium sp. MF28]MBC2458839.1 hypothetical protein [Clostridium beijerinckii]MBC2476265.1 hypothetical protein [Clostridium beijerinckii]MCI1581203.1 hypothetical protein [Clostridium beijerinckii]
MKRYVILIFIFLLISSTTISQLAYGQVGKTLSQGIYSARDANLKIGSPMAAKIDSPNSRVIIIVIDSDQQLQELIRLGPQSPQHTIKPLDYGSSIIIFGTSPVTFT